MKAEFQIDSSELVNEIVSAVVKELKPMLSYDKQGEESLFTVEGLAEYLNVKKQWVYEKVHSNEIPHYKVGVTSHQFGTDFTLPIPIKTRPV